MSANRPAHEPTQHPTCAPATDALPDPGSDAGRHQRGRTPSPFATAVVHNLQRSARWAQWQQAEPRLASFDSLEEALEGWRRRDTRCYEVVAGLTAIGSRRGGDDDEAALAVTVLLEDGVNRVAATLSDVCEVDDVNATVWEEVKAAEPQLGCHAARYLLQRARQRLSRPAAGMVARVDAISLDARAGTNRRFASDGAGGGGQDRDPVLAVPDVEDPVEDLTDLLEWATGVGVIATEDVDLLLELLAAENAGVARAEAQRLVGERHGVAMRTIRRHRNRATARLRAAAPRYLAEIS